MATVEYQAENENENDAPYLYVLKFFYYILAGLSFFSCLVNVYQLIQFQAAQNNFSQALRNVPPGLLRNAPSSTMALASVVLFFTLCLSFAVCLGQLFTASSLKSRRNYTFCLVIAGLSCALGTLGTAVGVATFLVLVRPSVKRMFEQSSAQLG